MLIKLMMMGCLLLLNLPLRFCRWQTTSISARHSIYEGLLRSRYPIDIECLWWESHISIVLAHHHVIAASIHDLRKVLNVNATVGLHLVVVVHLTLSVVINLVVAKLSVEIWIWIEKILLLRLLLLIWRHLIVPIKYEMLLRYTRINPLLKLTWLPVPPVEEGSRLVSSFGKFVVAISTQFKVILCHRF